MKQKHFLSLMLWAILVAMSAGTLSAQSATTIKRKAGKPKVSAAMLKPQPALRAQTGFEARVSNPSVPPSQSMLRSALVEEIAGTTQYDLQSNGSEPVRVHVWDNGEVAATWTYSNQADGSGWPDRGSAYNRRTDWLAGTTPSAKLEAGALRSGFTNYVVTEDGTEFILAHIAKPGGGYLQHTLRRSSSGTTWTEANVPTNVPKGELWSKIAVDGNTIHVLSLTTPTGSTTLGEVYRGMDGHVLYWRSKDAGLSWDIVDGVIPGLDSSNYYQLDADKYCIAARDGKVAVGIFDSWNDSRVFTSSDGGDTWDDPYVIWDFPLDKYINDTGYTEDEIGGADPNAPTPLAIFTVDGSSSIMIDVLGYVHVFVGETYVLDADLTDNNTSYYPGINGLLYWNETLPDELFEITGSQDFNGNDTLDFVGVNGYGTGLSSMPACASDDNGVLYLAYSAGVENLDDGTNNYRHLYTMKSPDFGGTWSDPEDVNFKTDPDSILAALSEAVWPSAYKRVTDKFHFVYERDFVIGSAVQLTGTQEGLSDIVYIADAEIVGQKSAAQPKIALSVTPNPAADQARIRFELTNRGETVLEVLDVAGSVVRSLAQGNLAAGTYTVDLNVAGLSDGFYFVNVRSGNQVGVKKLVKVRM